MENYRQMTNDSIRIGLANGNVSTKRLSKHRYKELKRNRNVPSYHKLCAISKASEIIASRNKSIKRGRATRDPYVKRTPLVSCYGFRIVDRNLGIPLGNKKFESVPLNEHALKILEDEALTVKSFTLTKTSLSLCIAKEVPEIDVTSAVGIDRNLRNLTVGNKSLVKYYDMSRVLEIGEGTKNIVRSFKGDDNRIRKTIASKYGKRKKELVNDVLNKIPKSVVFTAKENRSTIVLEDITFIRSMYQKGNGQGNDYRRQLNNHWPLAEIKRQVEYKAVWSGVPLIHLTKSETRGTSSRCYQCGEVLQGSRDGKRELWC